MKANSDARKIQKAQRMEEKRLKEEEALREQGERDRDLGAWSNKMRTQHEVRILFGEICGTTSVPCGIKRLLIPLHLDHYAKDAGTKETESSSIRQKVRRFAITDEECGIPGSRHSRST